MSDTPTPQETAESGLSSHALFAVGDIAVTIQDIKDEPRNICREGERIVIIECRPNGWYKALWEETWKTNPKAQGFLIRHREMIPANA